MLKTFVIAAALTFIAVITVLAAWLASSGTEEARAQTPVDIAIDMDITGNAARTVGTIEDCGEIDSSGTNTIQLDVVLPDPGIAATDGIKGWQFDLLYDETVVSVTAEDQDFLLVQAAGSNLFSLSAGVPGTYNSAATDLGTAGIEPAGAQEIGPGVITRLTLTGVAQGTTALTLSNVIPVDASNNQIPINNTFNATVAVDETCTTVEPAPDVQITGLACASQPERVIIENLGNLSQDLTSWGVLSDPVTSQIFDLTDIGSLDPGDRIEIWSGHNADTADPVLFQYEWTTDEIFRDADASDFARIVDGTLTTIDQVNCSAVESTPTPTPTPAVGGTPTSTSTPAGTATSTATPTGGAGATPPASAPPQTGDSIPVDEGNGSVLPWLIVALGAAITAGATGYVIYGRTRGRLSR